MAAYEIGLIIVAVALLGAVVLPRVLEHRPLSFPIIYVGVGMALFWVIPGAPALDPVENAYLTERLTELVVIISLMGAGLKLDRPFSIMTWTSTWRMLVIAMPLTAGIVAVLAWGALGLLPATAILLGAVVAPTDPVLASGVEAGAPLTELEEETEDSEEGRVRFTLTSEAGLNDGLAFPFTNLAIATAGATLAGMTAIGDGSWLLEWFLVDVGYKIVAGVIVGYVIGEVMARFLFRTPAPATVAEIMSSGSEVMAGAEALATTFLAYGVTELIGGYGFIAVFVAALTLRHFEWEHEYYRELNDFAVLVERLLMATVLVLFGGAIVGGLLASLTWSELLLAAALLFVIRPVSGILAFVGSGTPWPDRAVVSFFGVRGIGSFYYLSHALAEASFQEIELLVAGERLWAFVGAVVIGSIVLHGITATPAMDALENYYERAVERSAGPGD